MNILGNIQLSEWLKKSGDVILTITGFLLTSLAGLGVVWSQGVGAKPTATLWALACLACGAVIGFLFGIPRVLQQDAPANPPTNNAAESNREAGARAKSSLAVNTNLEQISDWLTKIIVGVGLIEIKNFPGFLDRASSFIGGGLGGGGDTKVLAGSMILYFAVIGFLGGYLLTRLYLTGAFERAAPKPINVGGNELSVEEVSRLVRESIADLRTEVGKLQRGMDEMQQEIQASNPSFSISAAASPLQSDTVTVRSILWVDDFPKNNSLIVEHLNRLGIKVVTAVSTREGLDLLKSQKFDRLITDMGRGEDGWDNPTAGLDLIRAIRPEYPDLPIVVYASAPTIAKYGAEAERLGAVKATPSQTELIEALNLYG